MIDPRRDEILDIVAKETGIERSRLLPGASIQELGIPSLDMVQTIFELESRYDVEIPVVSEGTGSEFSTVGDLVDHVLATLDKAALDRSAGPVEGAAPHADQPASGT